MLCWMWLGREASRVGVLQWQGELPHAHSIRPLLLMQARSQMMDEVSSAVDDAMTDATPLGRDQGLLESTAQRFVDGEESSLGQSDSGEESARYPNSMQVSSHALHQGICALTAASSRGWDEIVCCLTIAGIHSSPHLWYMTDC